MADRPIITTLYIFRKKTLLTFYYYQPDKGGIAQVNTIIINCFVNKEEFGKEIGKPVLFTELNIHETLFASTWIRSFLFLLKQASVNFCFCSLLESRSECGPKTYPQIDSTKTFIGK